MNFIPYFLPNEQYKKPMVANPIDFPCKLTMISIFYVSEVWITIRRQPTTPNLIVFWMAFVVAPVIMKSIDPLMRPRLCRSVGKKIIKSDSNLLFNKRRTSQKDLRFYRLTSLDLKSKNQPHQKCYYFQILARYLMETLRSN